MSSIVHLNSVWVIALVVAIIFDILYPVILAFIANRRLSVSWKYFAFGALIFFLFQLISRVPLVLLVQRAIAPQLAASTAFTYTWLAILALTAGLFEEVGRYVGYRWLMRREEKTWNKAVMYGIGHGGLESMLLVGGSALLTLINLLVISIVGLNIIPPAQRPLVAQQFAAINAQPWWFPLLGAWERLWTVPVHIALSVLVLQVFRRGSLSWLWLAILAHAVVDFVTIGVLQILGPSKISSSIVVELIVAVFGLVALWVIWSLRDRPSVASETEIQSEAPEG